MNAGFFGTVSGSWWEELKAGINTVLIYFLNTDSTSEEFGALVALVDDTSDANTTRTDTE